MWLQVINKVKVTRQGQIKVTFKETYSHVGGFVFDSNAYLFSLNND